MVVPSTIADIFGECFLLAGGTEFMENFRVPYVLLLFFLFFSVDKERHGESVYDCVCMWMYVNANVCVCVCECVRMNASFFVRLLVYVCVAPTCARVTSFPHFLFFLSTDMVVSCCGHHATPRTSIRSCRLQQVRVLTPMRVLYNPATPLSYENVYNHKGSLVGTLMGDGVTVLANASISHATLCLAVR
jgi:hypothetical protein